MSMYFGLVFSLIDQIQLLREFTFLYMGVFIGGGMFLLLNLKQILTILAITLLINKVFFQFFSGLEFSDFLFNGGIAVLLMAMFMVFSVFMRFELVLRNTKSTVELQKSECQNRMLFNQNPRAMLIYALSDLKILDVNDTIVQKYGFSKMEFLNMDITDLRPNDDVDKLNAGCRRCTKW